MDWSIYAPAGIALVGVVVGLRSNRRWNERVERRELFNEFLDAAHSHWRATQRRDMPTDEEDPALVVQRVLETNQTLFHLTAKVSLVSRTPIANAARAVVLAPFTPDDPSADLAELGNRINYFQLLCENDLARSLRRRVELRRDLASVRATDWYPTIHPTTKRAWIKQLDEPA